MPKAKNIVWLAGVYLLCTTTSFGQAQAPTQVPASGASATVASAMDPDSPATNSSAAAGPQAVVPRLMKFSGALHDASGKPLTGTVDVTFSLYSADAGGSALWFETQSMQGDELGRYTVLLGAMHADGLPIDLFTSGEVRWLGIQVGSEAEQQPRVLLVSVPYALKAGDAETLGGKPASAYMLSDSQKGTTSITPVVQLTSGTAQASTGGTNQPARPSNSPATPCSGLTSDGTAVANSIAMFTAACNIQSSVLSQYNGNVGVGITNPSVGLYVSTLAKHDGDAQFNIVAEDTTSAAAGTGGGIDFTGYFNGTTNKAGFASIRGVKENGTQGNIASALIFDTRLNGSPQTERMRISSAGNLGLGISAPAHKLDVAGDINAVTSGTITTIVGTNIGTVNDGVDGIATNPAGTGAGVYGESDSNIGYGVFGYAEAASGATYGVYGQASSTNGTGVYGVGGKWAGYFMGNVFDAGSVGIGTTAPAHKLDVVGDINAVTSGTITTIVGTNMGTVNDGVDGIATNPAGTGAGVYGESDSNIGYGVFGYAEAASGATYGVYGQASSTNGTGVYGVGGKWAGYFSGDVYSSGHVGIGTATPSAKLEVNGTAKFDDVVTFANTQVFPHGAIFAATSLFNNFPSIDPAFVRVSGNSSPSATEAYRASVMPAGCTAGNLMVVLSSSASIMVILRKNAATTTLGCSISSATSCTDNVHTISVAAGDLISLEFTGGSTGTVVYTAFSCG